MIRIELFKTIEEIPLDKTSWNKMIQNNITNTIFQTYEWFHSWWSSFGKTSKLIFLIAYEGDNIIGFAPFMLSTYSYGQRILRFAGDLNADYCDFVINANHIQVMEAFFNYLYESDISWTSMLLVNIPDHSLTPSCMLTISHKRRFYLQTKAPVPTPTLLTKNHKADVSSIVGKYSINRHIRKLSKLGDISFINLRDRSDILPYIDLFFEQHIRRYQLKAQISQFIDKEYKDFYLNIINNFDGTNWLIFSVLLLDEKPIAFHIGFEYNKRLIWYKPSFDIEFRNYSPGTIMLKELIKYTASSDLDELDFTIGDEDFKSRFSNYTRYNQNIALYRSRSIYLAYFTRSLIGSLLHRLFRLFNIKK